MSNFRHFDEAESGGIGETRERAIVVRSLGLRLGPGQRIASHSHGWAQVVFAARGVMAVETERMRWVVPPTRCLWVPAGVDHAIEMMGETWMRTVYVRPDRAVGTGTEIRVAAVSPLLRELLLDVVKRGMLHDGDEVHRGLVSVLLAEVTSAPAVAIGLPWPVDPRAREVAERVRLSPGSGASLGSLVRGVGASERTIERVFLKETGLSFGRWRQQARLQVAVNRLAEGASVTAVAMECGYGSVSAFVSMFKRSLGETPGKYR